MEMLNVAFKSKLIAYNGKCKTRNDMEDNELFGERHEQEENGLYGRKHVELCDLHNVSGSLCDNPHCEDGIVDYCPYYKTPIYCQCCEQGDR